MAFLKKTRKDCIRLKHEMLVAVILHFVTKKIILKSLPCIMGNLEFELLSFGIRNSAQGIPNPASDWNSESNTRPEIVLDYLTCAEGLKWGDQINSRYFPCPSRVCLLRNQYVLSRLSSYLSWSLVTLGDNKTGKMTFWKRSCLPFTKSFRKIRLVKWNTTFWVGSFQWQISKSNGISDKIVLFFRTECFKRKFVFHFFKVIFDASFTP